MSILKSATINICLLFLSFSSNAVTPEKDQDLRQLMELLDVSAMPEQMAEMMITGVIAQERKRIPNMPKNVEQVISTTIRSVVLKEAPELFEMVEPLYDKYYTHSEIKELIKFFSSPIGRKYNAVVQPMMQDIIPIAQKWGAKIGPIAAREVERKLNKLGYK